MRHPSRRLAPGALKKVVNPSVPKDQINIVTQLHTSSYIAGNYTE